MTDHGVALDDIDWTVFQSYADLLALLPDAMRVRAGLLMLRGARCDSSEEVQRLARTAFVLARLDRWMPDANGHVRQHEKERRS